MGVLRKTINKLIKIVESMRIVQTFWSAKENLLMNSFGWLEPQYHLMSWTLSCLSLRENYNEVVLYTDSNGYKVLIEQLQLPYTDVVIQYDDLVCPRHQWAYSKILTYSLQKKPFLHIDGDVYLPKKLSSRVEQGAIVAQNREIGTGYYKGMIDLIQSEDVVLFDFLQKEVQKKSVSSYNAGILGGNDLEFIHNYCQTVFEYIDSNQLFTVHEKKSSHNILFEQILFYALAAENNREVTTVLECDINDNGYSYHDFCDFYSYESRSLMHIIGAHKRNQRICNLLGRTLLKKYPEYYQRIIEKFPEKHKRLQLQRRDTRSTSSYAEYLDRQRKKWQKISNDILFDLEKKMSRYLQIFETSNDSQQLFKVKRNPYLSIYEKRNENEDLQSDMALIPSLLNDGYHEVPIDDLSYNILVLLDGEKSFGDIKNELQSCFKTDTVEYKKMIESQIKEEMEYLFYNKLIYLDII